MAKPLQFVIIKQHTYCSLAVLTPLCDAIQTTLYIILKYQGKRNPQHYFGKTATLCSAQSQ